jgi:penicillin-binding protein 1B
MKKKTKRILRSTLSAAALFFLVAALMLIVIAEKKLSHFVLGGLGEGFSTTIHSAPYPLQDGGRYSAPLLLRRLKRLNYRENKTTDLSPGEFRRVSEGRLSIYLRPVETPSITQAPTMVHLTAKSNGAWSIVTDGNDAVSAAVLEPELIAELSGDRRIRREPAEWEAIPLDLVNAVVAVEDNRFFSHWGIDPRAVVRAALANARHLGKAQGGSTITQQLVKNLFLTPRKTFRRKLAEGFLAVYMDARFSKEKILTLYLNHIYLGQDGVMSVAGVQAASQYYFGKSVIDLDLPECALLAGLVRSPSRYNPFQNPSEAKARRDFVLKRMMDQNLLTHVQYVRAVGTPLKMVRTRLYDQNDASAEMRYYIDEIVRVLKDKYPEDVLARYGLDIHTTMDPLAQELAQKSAREGKFQAAVVVMNPANGDVLALVGGRDYQTSQFNRATQALRQPGSAFKPFVYGAALENGFTPATILHDEKKEYRDGEGKMWKPRNFDGVYVGNVMLRQALAESKNAASLDLLNQLGISKAVEFAERMGIERPLTRNLSLALGTSELTLLELTGAYAPFANGGFRVKPRFVTGIFDSERNLIETDAPEIEPAISPALSTLMTSLLETTVVEGTAKSLSLLGWTAPSAGKTGTTNGGRDAWFIGYTPDLLVGTWMGHDEAKAVNLAGAKNALPLWARFMIDYNGGLEGKPFATSKDVVRMKIDPLSGALARSGCPETIAEIFMKGSEPKDYCPLHVGGIKGWFNKLFKKPG